MLKRFLKNEGGNFAVIVAVSIFPFALAIGSAVDYSRLTQERTQVQDALDAAILAAGGDFMNQAPGQVKQAIDDYLKSNIDSHVYDTLDPIKVVPDKPNYTLTASVTGRMETSFMMLGGFDRLNYDVEAQIQAARGKMEIALVLDNTNSMKIDDKIGSLKTAAAAFVEQMTALNSYEDRVKIGIVPFANHVRISTTLAGSPWLSVPADETTCSMKKDVVSKSGCTTETRYADGVPWEAEVCTSYTYGPEYEQCTTKTWQGCIGSRNYPLNLKDMSFAVRVPGVFGSSWTCPSPIADLTADKTGLLTQINAMYAAGETYIPIGITWGKRLLSRQAPFTNAETDAVAASQKIKRALILMTDGENQKSAQLPGSPDNWGTDTDQADEWTTEVCNNVKAEGVVIYSVTFGSALDADIKTLIENCATSSDHYFHAASASDLVDAFADVSKQLTELYLSK